MAALKTPRPTAVDFETFGIEGRPDYPPVPTSVSIKEKGKPSMVFSWAQAYGNNCTWYDAKCALEKAWKTPDGVLFHHAKFDLAVAERHFDLAPPPWERIHDTMFLLFLDDPNELQIGLKPGAARLLNMPPEEQDEAANWLVSTQPVPGVRITKGGGKNSFKLFLPFLPGKVIQRYVEGDVVRTEKLFELLWTDVVKKRSMGAAYDRERRLLKVLLEVERQGIRVDLERLAKDVPAYNATLDGIDGFLRKLLKAPELNLNSDPQLLKALVDGGYVDTAKMLLTDGGNYSVSAKSLREAARDPALAELFAYRSELFTLNTTFMGNWLRVADRSGGLIYTDWHQTKGAGGGARTGRLSSKPNFQNIPTPPTEEEINRRSAMKGTVGVFLKQLPLIPLARSYILPLNKGEILLDRDYSQQEPRTLAHFEGGSLLKQYQNNPWIDFHDNAKAELEKLSLFYERKPVKTVNLGLIYGEGVGSLAEKIGKTVEETRRLKKAILGMYPGLKDMYDDMKALAANGEPLHTWGGRECYCEKPSLIGGKVMNWDYKMVNTLIQGSAADCTKEAICRYFETFKRSEDSFLINVHDELLASVPLRDTKAGMKRLQKAMESVEFDLPMLSEGTWGADWANMKIFDKKGKVLYTA